MELGLFLRGLPGGQALGNAKDLLLAKGAKAHFNKLIGRYGTVLELQLNTFERSLSGTVLLKGEATPIDIRVREYALETSDGKSVLVIDGQKIETSREWLTELIHDRIGQKQLAIPENLEWVVKLLS